MSATGMVYGTLEVKRRELVDSVARAEFEVGVAEREAGVAEEKFARAQRLLATRRLELADVSEAIDEMGGERR